MVMSKYLEIGPPILMIGLQEASRIGMVVFMANVVPVKLMNTSLLTAWSLGDV